MSDLADIWHRMKQLAFVYAAIWFGSIATALVLAWFLAAEAGAAGFLLRLAVFVGTGIALWMLHRRAFVSGRVRKD